MSSATENNSEVAVEKVVAATEENDKPVKAAADEAPAVAADNGTKAVKDAKAVKRPATEDKTDSKKSKKDAENGAGSDDDESIEEEIIEEIESENDEDEYDLPFGEEEDIDGEDEEEDGDDDAEDDENQAL